MAAANALWQVTRRWTVLGGAVLLLAAGLPRSADAQIKPTLFADGAALPTGFVQDPVFHDVFYYVEQAGRIRPVRNGVILPTDFLNLTFSIVSGGERGLLGLAFAPDYAESGRFWVNFTRIDDGNTVIARFKRSTWDPLEADPATRFDLVWPDGNPYIVQPYLEHKGGQLAFGPDGYLYIGLGDGGLFNDPEHRAQNPQELLGKMLRINVNVPDEDVEGYDVPPDNPFVSTKGFLSELWAVGLRNPWRFSFDSVKLGGTGALVIGDVGQDTYEEIDYEPPLKGGRNYGWRNREGMHDSGIEPVLPPAYEPLTDPIFEYEHFVGRSITGGFVYRGHALPQRFVGQYFFADLFGRIWSLELIIDPTTGEATPGGLEEHTAEFGGSDEIGLVSSFGMDADGELYVVSYSTGKVWRIDPSHATNQITAIDTPSGGIASQPFNFVGWAIDLGSPTGPGVDVVNGWALPHSGGEPILLGSSGGIARPDVAAVYGGQFLNSGFSISVSGLPPGQYEFVAYARSTVSGRFGSAKAVVAFVDPPAALLVIESPQPGPARASPVTISGWAIDPLIRHGTGIDAVHISAARGGGRATFLGAAKYGIRRPDVAGQFGSGYERSGWSLTTDLEPGTWTIIVSARSSSTGLFRAVHAVTVEIGQRQKAQGKRQK